MLTVKQPVIHHGYKPVHDLPTPPSTSRPSPPLTALEATSRKPPRIPRSISPPGGQPMSAPHRGLPPPAAMALAQPPPPAGGVGGGGHVPPGPPHPPPAGHQQLGQGPPPPHAHLQAPPPLPPQGHPPAPLPAPPHWQQQHQGLDDAMKTWLLAKAEDDKRRQEEEKRRQEEEKTQQERLRLEQRRTEHDILRSSLQGGIPPPMVAIVFAGMGGNTLPQDALDMARQMMYSQLPQPPPQQQQGLPAGGPSAAAEPRRDSQSQAYMTGYAGSVGVPSTPGSVQGHQHPPFVPHQPPHPGSPARQRGYSIPGRQPPSAPPSNMPATQTGLAPGGAGAGGERGERGGPTVGAGAQGTAPSLGAAPTQAQGAPEQVQSPSIYFHYWQPPPSQASGSSSGQPATPSVGESPRKRKATGPQQAAPLPSTHQQQRLRSPPFSTHGGGATLANPPPGRRRGHSRQRSDLSSYRPAGRGSGSSDGNGGIAKQEHFTGSAGGPYRRSPTPTHSSAPPTARDGDMLGEMSRQHLQQQQQHGQHATQHTAHSRSGPHSVSSLLSGEPSPMSAVDPRQFSSAVPGRGPQPHQRQGAEGEPRRRSPDDKGMTTRGLRERDDE